jgi:hypothetical protein
VLRRSPQQLGEAVARRGLLAGANAEQPEVGDLEDPAAVDHAVAGLEGAVALERRLVQVAHAAAQVVEHRPLVVPAEVLLLADDVLEAASGRVLEHERRNLRVCVEAEEGGHIFVPHVAKLQSNSFKGIYITYNNTSDGSRSLDRIITTLYIFEYTIKLS